ncbi:hypothetical protein POTOM_023184 [Populus tomentosa]|uniref:Ergosterol biosynthesis ERG4/ERG24 family n=1 Tax=Populus tomentosa TaxID=118781 RepID=A0A8X7ZPN9_POPTO|nr:hypothetical protein POTOM_023184 [Populus tomentosa]
MDLDYLLVIPSWKSVGILVTFFTYLAIAGSVLPAKLVPGVTLQDGSRLHYRCNGLFSMLLLVLLLGVGAKMELLSLTVISERGLELLSATFIFSFLVALALYAAGSKSRNQSSSLKPCVTGNLIHDWYSRRLTRSKRFQFEWFGIQLNPSFLGIDLKFFFVRSGMMGWLFINLSVLAKAIQGATLSHSMILYQIFCLIYILDYFFYEEYMTSTWDIIAERLGFMLVFGDLVWIPFTFSIQASDCSGKSFASNRGILFVIEAVAWSLFRSSLALFGMMGWWLLGNKVELTTAAVIANCFVFLLGYLVFRGANKQKHVFKKNPKALIWGKPPKVVGGKLLASGYWRFELTMFSSEERCSYHLGHASTPVLMDYDYNCIVAVVEGSGGVARHCNYLGDLLLALSFSLPCGISSPVPYFYPIYLLILLIWRERRDEARCAEKYKEVWMEYRRLVPWRILPYFY